MGKYARAARRDIKKKLGGGKVREAVLDIQREARGELHRRVNEKNCERGYF